MDRVQLTACIRWYPCSADYHNLFTRSQKLLHCDGVIRCCHLRRRRNLSTPPLPLLRLFWIRAINYYRLLYPNISRTRYSDIRGSKYFEIHPAYMLSSSLIVVHHPKPLASQFPFALLVWIVLPSRPTFTDLIAIPNIFEIGKMDPMNEWKVCLHTYS